MAKQKLKIGVIGVGFVGGSVKKYFEREKFPVFAYDKFKKIGSPAEVNKADVVFVCVPTPFHPDGRGFDLSAVQEALKLLQPGKVAVIKSTVLPGTTASMQKRFPKLKILFNPEFLRATIAYQDFVKPDRQVIGTTKPSQAWAARILALLPKAPFEAVMSSGEAEVVKYFGNSFLAMKVVFANEFYDLCKKLRLDYGSVMAAAAADPRITGSHLDVAHGGYRGYGGACFPKDVNAILQFAGKKHVAMELLKAAQAVNRKLLKKSGRTEEEFL
jgi:UDPglucose 6-dehydrogenase